MKQSCQICVATLTWATHIPSQSVASKPSADLSRSASTANSPASEFGVILKVRKPPQPNAPRKKFTRAGGRRVSRGGNVSQAGSVDRGGDGVPTPESRSAVAHLLPPTSRSRNTGSSLLQTSFGGDLRVYSGEGGRTPGGPYILAACEDHATGAGAARKIFRRRNDRGTQWPEARGVLRVTAPKPITTGAAWCRRSSPTRHSGIIYLKSVGQYIGASNTAEA